MEVRTRTLIVAGGLVVLTSLPVSLGWAGNRGYGGPYGFATTPSETEIEVIDIAVGPDGERLPPGKGAVQDGERSYQAKCAGCHGPTGTEGPYDRLVGGPKPVKTIGSYWPYATTIFDYLRRAMPFNAPGSLSDDEVYAITAWLLWKNQIIPPNAVMDATSLPRVQMPNRHGFVPDRRPDVR